MKLRIADRILVALAGLLLIACCAGIVAQMFFGVDLIGFATRVFSNNTLRVRTALIAFSVFLLLLGIYCFFVLFRHRKWKDKFITQRNDSGELAISIKALENMVNKCLEQHKEIDVQGLNLQNDKEGLLIRIRGGVAGGISIPLTVEALQRQIKQYVTACSGVEVKGIRVEIESSGPEAENAPFAIEAPVPKPLLRDENESKETVPTPAPASETVSEENREAPVSVPASSPVQQLPPEEDEEDDDRPLHQRLFKPRNEPCIIPTPPAAETGDEKTVWTEPSQPGNGPVEIADTAPLKEDETEEAGTEEPDRSEPAATCEETPETAGTPAADDSEAEEVPETEETAEEAAEDTAAEDLNTPERKAARAAFTETLNAFESALKETDADAGEENADESV